MEDTRLNRRALIATVGAGIAGSVAGCASPRVDRTVEGSSSVTVDSSDREDADGSRYTDVYEAVVDSVTLVRALGVSDPLTGQEGRGQGSGFLYDDTHVVTNEHVVVGSEEIDLQYRNGDWTGTRLAGKDYYGDLAVLEVDHVPDGVAPLALSDRNPVVGQEVLAIGNPLELEGSMSQGIVSGVNRSIDPEWREFSFPNIVQTDAAVNPGNSGGPLVDLDGEVVGVIHAGGGENIGFAISAALTERVVPALIEDGEYHHSFMGIGLAPVERHVATENDLEEAAGVIVTDTVDGGPAERVLQPSEDTVRRHGESVPVGGDVIVEMGGEPIPDRNALSTFLALETSPDDVVEIEVIRDGSRTTVDLTLDRRPDPPGQ